VKQKRKPEVDMKESSAYDALKVSSSKKEFLLLEKKKEKKP
jgi:hypothetical protein